MSSKKKPKRQPIHSNFGVALFVHQQVDSFWTDEQVKDFLQKRLGPVLPLVNCHFFILDDGESNEEILGFAN